MPTPTPPPPSPSRLLINPDSGEPSAANCSVEPLLVDNEDEDEEPLGGGRLPPEVHGRRERAREPPTLPGRLAIGVDCSGVRDKHALIFQLAVSARRRDSATGGRKLEVEPGARTPGGWPVAKTNASLAPVRAGAGRSILFTETPAGQPGATWRRRIPLGDLFGEPGAADELNDDAMANSNKAADNNNVSGLAPANERRHNESAGGQAAERKTKRRKSFAAPDEIAGKLMTLDEQVELLNELVFTIRATDLVRTSEPRAIYGSELRIRRAGLEPAAGRKWAPALGAAQVSRSTRPAEQQQPGVDEAQGSNGRLTAINSAQYSRTTTRPLVNQTQADYQTRIGGLLEWGGRHEIGITMAAIGATLLLSALTLTLIVLVLRARKWAPAGRPARDRRARALVETAPARSEQTTGRAGGGLGQSDRPPGEPASIGALVSGNYDVVAAAGQRCAEGSAAKPAAEMIDFLAPPASQQKAATIYLRAATPGGTALEGLPAGRRRPELGGGGAPGDELPVSRALYLVGGAQPLGALEHGAEGELAAAGALQHDDSSSRICDELVLVEAELAGGQLMGAGHRQLASTASYCSPSTCTSLSTHNEHSLTASADNSGVCGRQAAYCQPVAARHKCCQDAGHEHARLASLGLDLLEVNEMEPAGWGTARKGARRVASSGGGGGGDAYLFSFL